MKKTVIFGAGQGGRMIRRLLAAGCDTVAFCDNDAEKQGRTLDGLPVIAPDDLLELAPDCVHIAALNRDAARSIARQLRWMGFGGETYGPDMLRDLYDARLATMRLLADEIKKRGVSGDVAELGVYQGTFAAELNRAFPDRTLRLFDTFEGFSARDVRPEAENGYSGAQAGDFADTGLERVKSRLPHPDAAVFYPGRFPDTAPEEETTYALVSLDADLYLPTRSGLEYFYPRLSAGGAMLIHDYNSARFGGVSRAVDEYCREHGLYIVPVCDLHGTAVLMKHR